MDKFCCSHRVLTSQLCMWWLLVSRFWKSDYFPCDFGLQMESPSTSWKVVRFLCTLLRRKGTGNSSRTTLGSSGRQFSGCFSRWEELDPCSVRYITCNLYTYIHMYIHKTQPSFQVCLSRLLFEPVRSLSNAHQMYTWCTFDRCDKDLKGLWRVQKATMLVCYTTPLCRPKLKEIIDCLPVSTNCSTSRNQRLENLVHCNILVEKHWFGATLVL